MAPSACQYSVYYMHLTDNSIKVRKEIQQRLVAGLNRGNEFLINEAQGAAPVQSGALREGTTVISAASVGSEVAVGASKEPYARIVNRHNAPFWTQAWIRMKTDFGRFFRG